MYEKCFVMSWNGNFRSDLAGSIYIQLWSCFSALFLSKFLDYREFVISHILVLFHKAEFSANFPQISWFNGFLKQHRTSTWFFEFCMRDWRETFHLGPVFLSLTCPARFCNGSWIKEHKATCKQSEVLPLKW